MSDFAFISGFALVKSVLGNKVFYGMESPDAFMTDNSDAMRNNLLSIWPTAHRFFCHFHILQQVRK